MKNVHLLPTPQPSRLHVWTDENGSRLELCELEYSHTRNTQNIYITNDEEIKGDDWRYDSNYNRVKKGIGESETYVKKHSKKIILTTDQDLIKDGVQAIGDGFLEWFVKNPSCESVEVDKPISRGIPLLGYKIIIPKKNFYCGDKSDYDEQCLEQCETCVDKKGVDYGYLPKEEPKMIECYFTPSSSTSSATKCDNCGEEKFLHTIGLGIKLSTYQEEPKQTDENGKPITYWGGLAEPKQETLEEALYKYVKDSSHELYELRKQCFLDGYKLAQKRSYSEEDLMESFIEGYKKRSEESNLIFDNAVRMYAIALFKQFKNK
jgi:hypothetical protein